ncbi:MAG TPA: Fe-S protein assembly co-chaperone HscB [Burkholderiales bacterium]|nr:Fe-S protein assembly co-chaperone HscB [Burkholderiales bacterium]
MHDHFALFGLPRVFGLDKEVLEKAYRDIQAQVHPDRFAHAGDAERRASLQWTTRVNEAYRTLKDPVQRGRHLLELHGVDVAFETNTQMPTDFLMQQLELREELEAATGMKDPSRLDRLRAGLSASKKALEKEIGAAIDAKRDYSGAAELVRKLMFLDRLDSEIDVAYEAIEQ